MNGFHQTIGGISHGNQVLGQAVNALAVQGIHHGGVATRPFRQDRVGQDADRVTRGVLVGVRGLGGFAVVLHARNFLHLLVQAAAQSDIDFLKAAANTQHRHTLGNAGANQWQGEGVALRVQRQFGAQHLLLEMAGMHIGR